MVRRCSSPPPSVRTVLTWKRTYLDRVRTTPGPYTGEDFEPSEIVPLVNKMTILVIGAGGLGCEILKNLALSGFKDIHVIDMDTIDISNLNRQFLFRKSDVGKFKAQVAADFVMRRVKGVKITPHNKRIQDFDRDFYMQFQGVVCGLDSIEARRWINMMLVDIAQSGGQDEDAEDAEKVEPLDLVKPLIDGGTEGFKGQARVILPSISSCLECQLDMHVPRAAVPLCTIASIPRQPEHCVEWAHVIAWDEEKPFPVLDKDDPEHITWLFHKALDRARAFGISGITYALTQGVVKNIIPAIASTNAVIAASCCNELLKLATGAAPALGVTPSGENYMMYSGDDGIYTYTFKHERKPDCPVCSPQKQARNLETDLDTTLRDFLDQFKERAEVQLKQPSIRADGKTLYMRAPESLEQSTRPNLDKTLKELGLDYAWEVSITDPAFPAEFRYVLRPKTAG